LISYSTPAAPQLFRNIKVKDNDCINTSSFGISFPSLNFAAPITFDRIEIIGNRLEFCGLQGIFVGAVLWADLFGVTSVMITNNTVLNCNGGAAATQISLVMIGGVPNQRVHGICRDNICSTIPDPPTSLGGIQVNSNDGAGAIVAVHTAAGSQPANYLEAQVPLRGISTGWPYTGAATQERFVVGSGLTAAMIYNYARLVSP
ncbi:MAG: hypothetical protein H8E92_06695, partial [SAR86 cluster bacterium]|nr:hypothetical protein [SAR86 cluster bacterium]